MERKKQNLGAGYETDTFLWHFKSVKEKSV